MLQFVSQLPSFACQLQSVQPKPLAARDAFQWDRLQPGKGLHEYHQSRGAMPGGFPAKAGPTQIAFSQSQRMHAMLFSGTGFSREEAWVSTINLAA
ncbi:hypothetical protein ACQKEN_23345 [Pseudomonas sp. NPDC078416]|uniref:hypothetical protein n=1 Tax=Pseudomonas sp. NPDC078416 TaxID=3390637 RepID=UPI003D043AF4